ncbi:hypothetical protein [Thermomonas sp. XSG]|jgi:hypothetical protein|uniref:hypothetical protein n=1 Tax=Thermomonas sp. XSG TaxID=2771436 RepID=UPI001680000C|nr:hypothetical protein [Thermomonas sp. XSG]QNU15186.1 hypothetical protein ICG51_001528 [Thermomonas sp. XSG]
MTASISVLLPLRGAAPFLGQALASLQAQASGDWRGVLCPVGEAATVLAARVAATDPRFCAGPTAASEAAALALAADGIDTEFLCVLDPDDALAPQALAALHAALAARPDAGMAYSRHVLVDTDGRVLGPGPLCELPYSPEALLLDWMTGPLRLLRTAAYRRAGGYTDAHPDAIDYDLCLRLSETCAVVHVPQPLYLRRIHAAAPEVARWAEAIEARYAAFVAAVRRRGLDARYDTALQVDSWHILQRLQVQ